MKKQSLKFLKDYQKGTQDKEYKEIKFHNTSFYIRQYLPIIDKMTLAEMIAQGSFEKNVEGELLAYNPALHKLSQQCLIIKFYTNLQTASEEFTKIFDLTQTTGIYDIVLNNIPPHEITFLKVIIKKKIQHYMKIADNNYTPLGILTKEIKKVLKDLPELVDTLKNLDLTSTNINPNQAPDLNSNK